MSNLESERAILTELYSKHGGLDGRVIKQSQKVDKFIVEETNKINNVNWKATAIALKEKNDKLEEAKRVGEDWLERLRRLVG